MSDEVNTSEIIRGNPPAKQFRFFEFMQYLSDDVFYSVEVTGENEVLDYWKGLFFEAHKDVGKGFGGKDEDDEYFDLLAAT